MAWLHLERERRRNALAAFISRPESCRLNRRRLIDRQKKPLSIRSQSGQIILHLPSLAVFIKRPQAVYQIGAFA